MRQGVCVVAFVIGFDADVSSELMRTTRVRTSDFISCRYCCGSEVLIETETESIPLAFRSGTMSRLCTRLPKPARQNRKWFGSIDL